MPGEMIIGTSVASVAPSYGDASVAAAAEREVLAKCHASMISLQQSAPDWFAFYEDAQPDSAERAVLVELLRTAPDDFSRGLLYGNFLMRMAIATITQREFD